MWIDLCLIYFKSTNPVRPLAMSLRCGDYSGILASRADLFGAMSIAYWSFVLAVLRFFGLNLEDAGIFDALLIAADPTSRRKKCTFKLHLTHHTRIPLLSSSKFTGASKTFYLYSSVALRGIYLDLIRVFWLFRWALLWFHLSLQDLHWDARSPSIVPYFHARAQCFSPARNCSPILIRLTSCHWQKRLVAGALVDCSFLFSPSTRYFCF